jgi:hypothetical protein
MADRLAAKEHTPQQGLPEWTPMIMAAKTSGGNRRLLPGHLNDLRKSGLSDEQIGRVGFFSLTDPGRIAELLHWKHPADALGPCLVIPFKNTPGANGYARLKPDKPRQKGDKSVKYESPVGEPNHVFLPPGTVAVLNDAASVLLVTEGEKKASKADQEGFPCLGLVGTYGWQKKRPRDGNGKGTGPRELIDDLDSIAWQGRQVFIAFDSDAAEKQEVRWAEYHLAEALQRRGAGVKVVRLPANGSAKVGLDDYLVGHGADALRQLLTKAETPERPQAAAGRAERKPILITTDEHLVGDAAIAALAKDGGIYQRGGLLVRIVRDSSPAARGIRHPLAPRIEPLPPPLLRERLAANALWQTLRRKKNGDEEPVPARPPGWCTAAVHARGNWPGVRHLEAVVDTPVLRPNGTILCTPGYDAETGLLFEADRTFPSFPDKPTQEDALAARDLLLEVVHDFPFQLPAHRSAWLASVLTPLARYAFAGPAPLFLADANVPAAGKGLLLDCTARILTGERFTIATYTSDEDELRKRITSLCLAGARMVLFDNLEGRFGNATLDAALTATAWEDRVLGINRMTRSPLLMTWYATGNNVAVHKDTSRRCCCARLESELERPEERSDFRHPDLLAWVGQNRDQLLAAALTILRAYFVAGKPDQKLKPWGSFEGWSAVVRAAIQWVGMPDPGETRMLLQQQADVGAAGMAALVGYWQQLDPERKGLTTAEVIARLYAKDPPANTPAFYGDMRATLEDMLGKVDARGLGTKLRGYRRRVFGGWFFDQVGKDHQAVRWAVLPANEFGFGPKHTPHTPDTPRPEDPDQGNQGECGESGECFGVQAEVVSQEIDPSGECGEDANHPAEDDSPGQGYCGECGEDTCTRSEEDAGDDLGDPPASFDEVLKSDPRGPYTQRDRA